MSSYSAQEVADRLGVSIFTIRRHIRSGRLVARREAGTWQIRRQDLEAFLLEREIPVYPTTRNARQGSDVVDPAAVASPDPPPSSART